MQRLVYAPQGAYPFCVSFACTTLLEWKRKQQDGVTLKLSQPHLCFHSGGSERGSYFRANLDTLRKKGGISYAGMPMPGNIWERFDGWHARLRAQALGVPFKDTEMILGYVRVQNDPEALKRAILEHGPLLVGVYAGKGYYRGVPARTSSTDNHAVLLSGWDDEGNWEIFDSLMYVRDDNGVRYLDKSYTFHSAYAITELPRGAKKKVERARAKGFKNCLDHYGKPRNFALEQKVASRLTEEFEKFQNQSVWEAAGKFWTVYVNAVAYGGYSISYKKFGRWQPGDIINDCYHWRRTGQHIFDFNKLRSEH